VDEEEKFFYLAYAVFYVLCFCFLCLSFWVCVFFVFCVWGLCFFCVLCLGCVRVCILVSVLSLHVFVLFRVE